MMGQATVQDKLFYALNLEDNIPRDQLLRCVAIELKSVSRRIRSMTDCQLYVEQSASYASAKGERVALICILDCSAKDFAPWPWQMGWKS